MSKFNVGLIGCGYVGKKRAAVIAADNASKLEIIADSNLPAARRLAKAAGCAYTGDWREAVDTASTDVVVVATSNDGLATIASAALKNKKHVLCEKPMARNVAEARPLVRIARDNGVILKAGFSLRYHPAISHAHCLFKEGLIGEAIFVRCRYGHGGRPGYDREWRSVKKISGGGELLDQGVHITDLFHWFLGDFEEAFGYNAQGFWVAEGIEDNAFALFKTKSNQVASVHVSCTQWKNLFSFELFGNKGNLIAEGLGGSYGPEKLIINQGAGTGKRPAETEIYFKNDDSCWETEWSEFTAAIKEGRQPSGNGDDALKALEMVEAIYQSDAEGKAVFFHDLFHSKEDLP